MKPQNVRKITKIDVILKGLTPYSQSRYLDMDSEELKKQPREKTQDYDERIWREKGHWSCNGNNEMVIPRRQMRVMMANVAQYKGVKVEGQGQAKYTKHFKAGILVTEDFSIVDHNGKEITKENVLVDISYPDTSTGSRVKTRSPIVMNGWVATGYLLITDPTITQKIFLDHLVDAGLFIGLGRFRVGNGGDFGTFSVEDIEFSTIG